jgi:hypothetical protein
MHGKNIKLIITVSCNRISYRHKWESISYIHYKFPPRVTVRGGSFVGTVSCSARWTGWLVQVSKAECLRGLAVVVMMMNFVGGRQAVAVTQENGGWAHWWGSPAGDATRAARCSCLLTALLPIDVPSPFGPRVLEPNLCERCRICYKNTVLFIYIFCWPCIIM